MTSILEETVQLSKNMSIADAVHDNKIVENVQSLQQQSVVLTQELQGKLEYLDPASSESVDACLLLCSDLLNEVEKDVLHVTTETCSRGTGFATKSTVSLPRFKFSDLMLDNLLTLR